MLRRGALSYFLAIAALLVGWIIWSHRNPDNRTAIALQVPITQMQERLELEKEMIAMLLAKDNVLKITSRYENELISGTGFSILGAIITANHVTAASGLASVYIDGNEIVMPIIGSVQTKDISFIAPTSSVSISALPYMSARSLFKYLARKNKLEFKDVLVGLRCMSGEIPRIILGELVFYDLKKSELSIKLLHESTSGCSGGPVITYDGLVIGVYQAHFGTLGEALDINDAVQALAIIKSKNHSLSE